LISNNTIVNCKEALNFGAGADSKRIIPSTGLKVEDNLVINSTVFLNVKAKPLNAMVQNNEVLGIFTPTDGFTKAKIETKINKYQLYQKANAVQPFWLFQQIGPSYFKMPKFNIK
jgi:hypothetical protein